MTVHLRTACLTSAAMAAIGGVLFLSEPVMLRFALASLLIIGGVALAVLTPDAGSARGGT